MHAGGVGEGGPEPLQAALPLLAEGSPAYQDLSGHLGPIGPAELPYRGLDYSVGAGPDLPPGELHGEVGQVVDLKITDLAGQPASRCAGDGHAPYQEAGGAGPFGFDVDAQGLQGVSLEPSPVDDMGNGFRPAVNGTGGMAGGTTTLAGIATIQHVCSNR